jgi:hypothetical protein
MARKPFVVTHAVREKVRHLAGLGVPQDDIARIVRCSPKTLRKRCRDDLDCGVAEANAIVSGCLFAAAKGGSIAAQIFWLKSRAQWRERAAAGDRAADGDAEANSPVVLGCPTTAETRSWWAFKRIASSENADVRIADTSIYCKCAS